MSLLQKFEQDNILSELKEQSDNPIFETMKQLPADMFILIQDENSIGYHDFKHLMHERKLTIDLELIKNFIYCTILIRTRDIRRALDARDRFKHSMQRV